MKVHESGARGLPTTLAEINVTPLVDVMLVLLIIFMVSAPMMQQGVQVNLPKANAGTLDEAPKQLVLVIDKQARVLIHDRVIPKGTLAERLEGLARGSSDLQVFVQADQSVPYGVIAKVIAEIKRAKIYRVGLVTQPGDTGERF